MLVEVKQKNQPIILNKKNMKSILLAILAVFLGGAIHAQKSIDLSGKAFAHEKNTTISSSVLKFKPNNQVVYVITNDINGKIYVDECPGKSTIQGNKISIVCNCPDKEIYPDPIKDSFTFDAVSNSLISGSKNLNGKNIIWKSK